MKEVGELAGYIEFSSDQMESDCMAYDKRAEEFGQGIFDYFDVAPADKRSVGSSLASTKTLAFAPYLWLQGMLDMQPVKAKRFFARRSLLCPFNHYKSLTEII